MKCYRYNGEDISLTPRTLFYDYIYIRALSENKGLLKNILEYNTFTDIEFNQKIPYSDSKGPFNCQARSCAICVWLVQHKLLMDYLDNPECYIEKIYPKQVQQPTLFA